MKTVAAVAVKVPAAAPNTLPFGSDEAPAPPGAAGRGVVAPATSGRTSPAYPRVAEDVD